MKTAYEYDLELLKQIIKEKEDNNQYSTHSSLFSDVAKTYNEKKSGGRDINAGIVGLRVSSLQIPLKTAKGRRGRQAGTKIESGNRTTRGEKFAGSPKITKHFAALERVLKADKFYQRYGNLLEKAKAGSASACVKLTCLQCVNYDVSEIKECPAIGVCPLYPIRPFRHSEDINGVEDNEGD